MTVSWRVSVCPSGTGFGMYIYENIYLYWIYAANHLGRICQLNIYVDIGYWNSTFGCCTSALSATSISAFVEVVGPDPGFKHLAGPVSPY